MSLRNKERDICLLGICIQKFEGNYWSSSIKECVRGTKFDTIAYSFFVMFLGKFGLGGLNEKKWVGEIYLNIEIKKNVRFNN